MRSIVIASGLLILMIAGCVTKKNANPESSSNVFTGGKWMILEISGMAVDPAKAGKELPYLDFDLTEKKMNVFAGCNRMTAGFTVSKDTLALSPMISTRMACPDMDYEYALQRLLVPGNYSYIENGDVLELFYNSDKVLGLKRFIKK